MSYPMNPNVNQSPEVSGARSRLTDVLQNLVERAEKNAEESEVGDELNTSPRTPEQDSKVGILDGSKGGRKHHKRKRKKDYRSSSSDYSGSEKGKYQQSFVMKLFDRQVDLAQFRASSPLYPVCREWMYNQPLKKRRSRTRTPSPEPPPDDGSSDSTDQTLKDIYQLPPPSISSEELIAKRNRDPRVPSPEPQPEESLNIYADMSQAPSKEALLDGHLVRWRNIKNKWKAASDDYQSRYAESYNILKAMYDRV